MPVVRGCRSARGSIPPCPGSAPWGEGPHVELTALGDAVNVTARLASAAGPGEILVTSDAARAGELDPSLPRRRLELKGKQDATEVVTLVVEASPVAGRIS